MQNTHILTGIIILLLISLPLRSHGHAMFAQTVDDGIGIRAVYDHGRPAAFSEVSVFAPDETTPFSTGTTDSEGYYMFRADRSGTWRVKIDDGMGHAAGLTYDIDQDGVPATVAQTMRMPRKYGLITGLSLIFGVLGWSSYWRLKRQPPTGKEAPCISPTA